MAKAFVLKKRPSGFLDDVSHDSETFDYIRELHELLWRFVRAEYPHANGMLDGWITAALASAETRVENERA